MQYVRKLLQRVSYIKILQDLSNDDDDELFLWYG